MNSPLFFIGSSPSMAKDIVTTAAGVMVSMVALRKRKSDFAVGGDGAWILDSGAFTEIARNGAFENPPKEYIKQIARWAACGNLLTAVTQDFMCEDFVLKRTGLTVQDHQRLTVERYHELVKIADEDRLPVPLMPVLQGYTIPDYLACLQMYGDTLALGQWVGVGSVCKRNGNPEEIADILRTIKLVRPDLRLHGFGLKQLALTNAAVRELLYSCDSMAWSYPAKLTPNPKPLLEMAATYQETIDRLKSGQRQRPTPATAGAGNGQGRKGKWKNGKTVAIRVPEKFAAQVLELARELDGR